MSAQRALPKLVNWPGYEKAEGNSTAQTRDVFKGTNMILGNWGWPGPARFGWTIMDWPDEPMYSVLVKDPVLQDLSPTAILVRINEPDDFYTYEVGTAETTLYSELRESVTTYVPPEYELLRAITDAPEEQRLECMRALGLLDADNEGYDVRGPDPQTVDFELMALLDPEQHAS